MPLPLPFTSPWGRIFWCTTSQKEPNISILDSIMCGESYKTNIGISIGGALPRPALRRFCLDRKWRDHTARAMHPAIHHLVNPRAAELSLAHSILLTGAQ